MSHILIAEDESRIASFLQKGLEAHGFDTTIADDGVEATHLAHAGGFDLLILDLGLPGKSGLQVIEELRGQGVLLPIIVLTVIQDIQDKVKVLEAGANDYVTKPFSIDELIARIRVQFRYQHFPSPNPSMMVTAGGLQLDLRQRTAQWKGKTIELSTREFTLLELLARHPEQVWTREELLNRVWGYNYELNSNIVDVYVGYLRKKIGSGVIKTVRGVGYALQV